MKELISIVFLVSCAVFPIQFGVDSVTVDSVYSSDSSWYDNNGILQHRKSLDCILSFIPTGEGLAECNIYFSANGGTSWSQTPNPLTILDNALSTPVPCNEKKTVIARIAGENRSGTAFRVTARQYAPVITGAPRINCIGICSLLTPGAPVEINTAITQSGTKAQSVISRVHWNAHGDTTIDDSTVGLSWNWRTNVPTGSSGQRRGLIVKARDINGLWSAPETLVVQFGLLKELEMVNIAEGTFSRGGGSVSLSQFTISSTEISQDAYEALTSSNPSYFKHRLKPVENVTWWNAALFCNALSKVFGYDTVYAYASSITSGTTPDYSANGFRLPTEAEWEYCYRSGTTSDFYWGGNYPPVTSIDTIAIDSNAVWQNNSNKFGSTSPLWGTNSVSNKKSNAFGLYDMAGNVLEWCNDWYGSYGSGNLVNPTGPSSGSGKTVKGGSWMGTAYELSATFRDYWSPSYYSYRVGFRVVRKP